MDTVELKEKLAQARKKSEIAIKSEPYAVNAFYDADCRKITVELSNNSRFSFPPDLAQGLVGASSEDLGEVEITPSGQGLHWETLDTDLSIPELINGIFGTEKWMSELGKKGGLSRKDYLPSIKAE